MEISDEFVENEKLEEEEEEEEEEFCSCCAEEEDWEDSEEDTVLELMREEEKESGLKMFFKGVSIAPTGDSECGFSGIGVVMERSFGVPVIQVQKKLEFYVEESVAEYLALLEGLVEAMQTNTRRILAFTDCKLLYDQLVHEERHENQLLIALKESIMKHASKLDSFILKLIPTAELERPLRLAQIAIGIVCLPSKEDKLVEDCSICCEEKLPSMMISMKCSHKFCSHCMRTYVEGKIQTSQVPVRCPQVNCKYYIPANECRCFLPEASYKRLEKVLVEANFLDSEKIYCPFPNCSVLLNPRQRISTRASSSSHVETNCYECPECERFICLNCEVPWHASLTCEEYQKLPIEERDAGDITLHHLAQNKKWRRCQKCRRMIELTQGCYHITCWCRHEFCYSCGAEYNDGHQTCECAFWDEESFEIPVTQFNDDSGYWGWDFFDSVPTITDAYSDQERSQLALIQRFLAGGFDLSDHHPYQSPPQCTDPYVDTIKELHQLPWLERFVSVISDNYYEDYIH